MIAGKTISAAKTLKESWKEIASRCQQGYATDDEEQAAWDTFTDFADTHKLCLGCLCKSPGHSYCDDCMRLS